MMETIENLFVQKDLDRLMKPRNKKNIVLLKCCLHVWTFLLKKKSATFSNLNYFLLSKLFHAKVIPFDLKKVTFKLRIN